MATLLFRYISKELSREEERELTAWRYRSREHEKLFQEKTDRETILAELARHLESRDRVFQKVKMLYPGPWEKAELPRRFRIWQTLEMGFVLALILITGLYLTFNRQIGAAEKQPGQYQAVLVSLDDIPRSLDDFHRGFLLAYAGIEIDKRGNGELLYIAPNDILAARDKYNTLYTLRGRRFSLKLPDGTIVWLNEQSSIKYPANFSQDSVRVIVEGEAYFELASHGKPGLKIMAGLTETISAGAFFDIHAYPKEPASITVFKGEAQVRMDSGKAGIEPQAIVLRPHEQVKWRQGILGQVLKPGILAPELIQGLMAWKNENTVAEKTDMQRIMQAISR